MPLSSHPDPDGLQWEDEDDDDSLEETTTIPNLDEARLEHLEEEFQADLGNLQAEFQDLSRRTYSDSDEDVIVTDHSCTYRSQQEEDDSIFWAQEDATLHNLNESYTLSGHSSDPLLFPTRRSIENHLVDVSHRDLEDEQQDGIVDVSHRDLEDLEYDTPADLSPPRPSPRTSHLQPPAQDLEEEEEEDYEALFVSESDASSSEDTITSDDIPVYDPDHPPEEALPERKQQRAPPRNPSHRTSQSSRMNESSRSRMQESSRRSRGTSLLFHSRRKSQLSHASTTKDNSSDEHIEDPLLVVDKTPNMISERSTYEEEEEEEEIVFQDDPDDPKVRSASNQKKHSIRSARDQKAVLLGMLALCCCCALLVVVIILPIYFLVIKDNDNDNDNESTRTNPTPAPTSYLLPLPDYTMEAMQDNLLSPQAKAYEWLRKDPNRETYSEARNLQRFALASLYYGLRGDNWTTAENQNWLDYEASECTWGFRGVNNQSGFHTKCDTLEETTSSTTQQQRQSNNIFQHPQLRRNLQEQQPELYIVQVKIPHNNAVGTLPPELQMLSELQTLDLGHNTIFGSLPTQMASMRHLTSLNLTKNLLTGSLPWLSSPLAKIDLSHNQFQQPLPGWLASLSTLQVLDLSYNQFSGNLLTSILSWGPTLKTLRLHFNQLTGMLPNEVGFLSNLEVFEVDHNQLQGTMPTQLGAMLMMEELLLYNNDLSGPIPSQIGNLKQLRDLGLTGNKLNETIPIELGLLTMLESLWLYDNELTGTIPESIGNLADYALKHAILYDNEFTGVVPDKLCTIDELQFDCGPLCGCECTTCDPVDGDGGPDINGSATLAPTSGSETDPIDEEGGPDSNSSATFGPSGNETDDEFTIGNVDGQEVFNGTMAPGIGQPDLGKEELYGIRRVYHAWEDENITLQYELSDYILDDSMEILLYDGAQCRNGSNNITEDNEYLILNWVPPDDGGPDLQNEGMGTRSFNLFVSLNPATNITAAPFYISTEEGGRLDFCIGLSIDYNQNQGWTVVEVNAVELAITVDLNSSGIEEVDVQIVTPPDYSAVPGADTETDPNPCEGKTPDLPNVQCVVDGVDQTGEQSPVNVTSGYQGLKNSSYVPLTSPFLVAGLCPVNVNWRLGAEHYSVGEYDETGSGPRGPRGTVPSRLGYQCQYYNESDSRFTTEYNWTHCQDMQVGQTYEIQWPHSAAGDCGTAYQYQTPATDGLFCKSELLTDDTPAQIGFQAQVFTVVNDEEFYYPDLISGMVTVGVWGKDLAMYTGSTTGASRDNEVCSQFSPITWHVDRVCHMVSASSFDKLCSDMKAQSDDMSEDLFPHAPRELVVDALAANNHVN